LETIQCPWSGFGGRKQSATDYRDFSSALVRRKSVQRDARHRIGA
jgi:hypothetical protein